MERFNDAMIREAERYAGISGSTLPTTAWKGRNGETTDRGMSYCFGCKQSVDDFNGSVADCKAETKAQIETRETDAAAQEQMKAADPKYSQTVYRYRGNVNANCVVEQGGAGDWAGLMKKEYDRRGSVTAFEARHWAGVDCAGLAQRGVENGRGVAAGLKITIPKPDGWISSQEFFTDAGRTYYKPNPVGADVEEEQVDLLKKLRRGDLVRYDGHISTVHSARPTCADVKVKDANGNETGETTTACTYEIVHAYGTPRADLDNDPSTPMEFTRKVVITPNSMSTSSGAFSMPTGFGRIKLWD